MRILAVMSLSLATALSSVLPAQAFPSINSPALQSSDVQLIQYHGRGSGGRGHGGYWPRGGRHYGGYHRGYGRHGGYYGGYRRYGGYGGHGYYGGGYGYGNNYGGLVIGGLAAGVLLGSMLAQPRYYGNSGQSWCYSRYRSYRAYDNTFQPYHGPRRQCIAPY
ncbi:BA14K family protein [Neorhizobium sp. P12A]|uniref:BA14K family protein n=1 Tax=Neorhizobium sp. P12A TaxID=2268027 RepID=UPI0011F0068F|nr:BA14K family protein [Neorhizobium sp. P12A]KAA0689109.1 BA14K family protein [Neorhizobium sp. P12A]